MEIYRSKSDDAILAWQWCDPSLRNITHLVLKHAPPSAGIALDVGCGTGRISFALADRGFRVRGIDIEERAIRLAREIAERRNDERTAFEVGDFATYDHIPRNHYDLVVCCEVLEHVPDYQRVVENMHTALKPGGRIIITVPFEPRKWSVLDEYSGHLQRFTISQMKSLLSGFSRIKCMVTGFPFSRLVALAYLAKIRFLRQRHATDVLWTKPGTQRIAAVLYPLFRLDNFFAFTWWGDTLVAVATKLRGAGKTSVHSSHPS